jgi:hypothetical protein
MKAALRGASRLKAFFRLDYSINEFASYEQSQIQQDLAGRQPRKQYTAKRVKIQTVRCYDERVSFDLPLNFHPAAIRASAVDTPFGAV